MTDKEWFDKYAIHMIDMELYAEARANLALDVLKKMFRELKAIIESYGAIKSRAQEQKCEKECNECIKKYLEKWEEEEEKERTEYAEKETDWLSDAVKAALGITVLSAVTKIKHALEAPFSESDNFSSFVDSVKESVMKAVRTPLLSSRIFGTSASTMSNSLDSSLKRISANVESGMKTAVTGLQRNIQRQLLEDKRKLRFVYISMLDSSVCTVCGGYSGNIYEDMSKVPSVPVHFRCRCYYMPVLSSSENGIRNESYQDWFDRQPDSVKYKILGATRYNFYKAGLSDITKFSSKGRKLTLKEIFNGKVDTKKPKHPYNGIWQTEKITKNASLHIAKERLESGLKDPAVYGSDKMMAKTLARETGKDVWLLPETHKEKGAVNPDAFFEGKMIEFKHVNGKIDKVGKNAIKALSQSCNVFLYIEGDFSFKSCLDKIKGSYYSYIGTSKAKSLPYTKPDKKDLLYLFVEQRLFVCTWGEVL